jgi:phosphoglycerol transferase MdoB-like AlkP superfamily enzyme
MSQEIITLIIATALITQSVNVAFGCITRQIRKAVPNMIGAGKSLFPRHWRIIPAVLDFIVIFMALIWLKNFSGDPAPATRDFVVLTMLLVLLAVWSGSQFPAHLKHWWHTRHPPADS